MLRHATLLILAIAALAYGQKVQSENDHKPDAWQKMKDCAAQAEKVGPSEAEINKGSYINHYSPKYDRCFIRISWLVMKGEQASGQGMRLFDAFEHKSLAYSLTPSPGPESKVCYVDSGDFDLVDCSTARDFIAEHMRN